ncbi:Smr/MutS family protein [Sphingobacterium pedocola]|uniref:Smr domain-containing protein n=1 Tax=Sphingobacterium pedocola TaxID=2082722 RepID=A0ABR9TD69_9SPHI|nr:Smr/MutS family protein [Sphingobacterium pedocola]MBE8723305.1 hypothetical protein [Sphingobacterium pedocola]
MARELRRPAKVVDLHADTFLSDWEDYDADELLAESLELLRETLDAAIYWEYTEIRFIHGKGKGTLRREVYNELESYKSSGAIASFHPSYQNEDIVVVHIGL